MDFRFGLGLQCRSIVFNATFNKFSIISWRSVLLMEEAGVPIETTDLLQVTDTLSHNVASSTPRLSGGRTHNISGEDTDCTGSWKSNYQAITTAKGFLVNKYCSKSTLSLECFQ